MVRKYHELGMRQTSVITSAKGGRTTRWMKASKYLFIFYVWFVLKLYYVLSNEGNYAMTSFLNYILY
jgi:hypothetical protein